MALTAYPLPRVFWYGERSLLRPSTFDLQSVGWSGVDLETNLTENAYLGNGSTNRVAKLDGRSGQRTVMRLDRWVDHHKADFQSRAAKDQSNSRQRRIHRRNSYQQWQYHCDSTDFADDWRQAKVPFSARKLWQRKRSTSGSLRSDHASGRSCPQMPVNCALADRDATGSPLGSRPPFVGFKTKSPNR